ncbi:hypothetical protein MKX03_004109 [Papaver bracteatum]|nr:hypothetical protein MKX03_004109 [Papaver bracteatum]
MYNEITRDIVLWNPAMRQCRLLPKSLDGKPKDGYEHREFVGLGFDFATKDYKVIQVSSLQPRTKNGLDLNIGRKVQIYCLSTDSWRFIDSDFRTPCFNIGFGRSLNGIYFHQGLEYTAQPNGYCTQGKKSVILSFDLSKESKEKYQRVVQIPENNCYQLESIDDKLACVTSPRERGWLYKVWMLKDYNTVKELWTELYRVDVMAPRLHARYGCWGFLTISLNGKFGLFQGKTLVLYNPITDEFEDSGFGEGLVVYTLMGNIYKESLVSVNANGGSATKAISS